jgi:hypothetical protein
MIVESMRHLKEEIIVFLGEQLIPDPTSRNNIFHIMILDKNDFIGFERVMKLSGIRFYVVIAKGEEGVSGQVRRIEGSAGRADHFHWRPGGR